MITRDGAKMSKSKGNTVSPAEYVERFGADADSHLRLFHGPAGARRRLDRRRRRGRSPLPLPLGASATRSTNAPPPPDATAPPTGDGPTRELLAKAHWAIDKVDARLRARLSVQHGDCRRDGAGQRRYRLKDELYGDPAGDAALRFATSTAGSLIFPFAPHLGAEVFELLEGHRVWEQPWPEADPALLEPTPSRSSCRSTASCATGSRPARVPTRPNCCVWRAKASLCGASGRQGSRQGSRRSRQARQSGRALRNPAVHPVEGRFCYKPPVLVRRQSEAAVHESHRLRSHILMDAGELGSRHMSVTWIEVPPGTSQSLHSHEESEQIYVVVRGDGKMSAAGDTAEMTVGDLCLIPPATDHSITNDGTNGAAVRAVARRLGRRAAGAPARGKRRRLRSLRRRPRAVFAETSGPLRRSRLIIRHGRVQGVFFRDTMRRRAPRIPVGLMDVVTNRANGHRRGGLRRQPRGRREHGPLRP